MAKNGKNSSKNDNPTTNKRKGPPAPPPGFLSDIPETAKCGDFSELYVDDRNQAHYLMPKPLSKKGTVWGQWKGGLKDRYGNHLIASVSLFFGRGVTGEVAEKLHEAFRPQRIADVLPPDTDLVRTVSAPSERFNSDGGVYRLQGKAVIEFMGHKPRVEIRVSYKGSRDWAPERPADQQPKVEAPEAPSLAATPDAPQPGDDKVLAQLGGNAPDATK